MGYYRYRKRSTGRFLCLQPTSFTITKKTTVQKIKSKNLKMSIRLARNVSASTDNSHIDQQSPWESEAKLWTLNLPLIVDPPRDRHQGHHSHIDGQINYLPFVPSLHVSLEERIGEPFQGDKIKQI